MCVCRQQLWLWGTPAPLREPWLGHFQGRAVTAGSIVRQLSLEVFHYIELRSVPFNFYPQILVLLSGETQTRYIQLNPFVMKACPFWNSQSPTLQLFSIMHCFQTSDCYSQDSVWF